LGPVYRAYDAERERLVAVKLFNLDLPPQRVHQLVAGFEHLIAAELTHPTLAAPLATGITGVSAFLAQDYVAAESLDLAVREYGPAPPADALRVAAQLAGALDFAALSDISHGALHPRDVLLSSDDTRLTGIGVARALEQVGVTAPIRRPYSPPERIAGVAWDRRADVFGLAALIHELLWARRVSGSGAHAAESLSEIEGGDLDGLRSVFSRALAENPSDRFDTALEFAQALKHTFPHITLAVAPVATRKRRTGREEEPRLPLDVRDPLLTPIAAADVFDGDTAITMPEHTPDLDLRVQEHARYEAVETAPVTEREPLSSGGSSPATADAFVDRPSNHEAIPSASPGLLLAGYEPEPRSAFERSRSAVWPLVLALVVGLAMGFAGGYGVGSQQRPSAGLAAGTPAPAGREFTDGAVPATAPSASAAKPSPPPATKSEVGSLKSDQKSEAGNQKSETESGRLLVRSTPTGAQVFVDGHAYGRTPATVRDLPHGTHRVRIERDGYVAEERRVVLTQSRPAQSMTVALERPRGRELPASQVPARAVALATPSSASHFTGKLRVESRPPGATVYLDGKVLGTTPVSLPVVPAGEHAIRLERDGYHRWSSSVRIVASEENRITASLER
jgi:PEGA domain/Protein kinase domain